MKNAERWLLPDGIEEVLPSDAARIERLRRRQIDHFEQWGYQLVVPPVLEFTDSLLASTGSDLDLLTLKVTDQLSGKMMGLRPDMTTQAARMDAHSVSHKATSRLCYAGHVIHAKPLSLLANRTPLHAGVELFGESSIEGDIEVLSLLLSALSAEHAAPVTLSLGHVAICRSIVELANLSHDQADAFFGLLQAKAMSDIHAWLDANVSDHNIRQWLSSLPDLHGGIDCLSRAREQIGGASPQVVQALDELVLLFKRLHSRFPSVNIHFDLSELRGYHYHTGIVFSAFTRGFADALAHGGRYDDIGEAFGRARAATGFSLNLTALFKAGKVPELGQPEAIYVLCDGTEAQWHALSSLRNQGETVIVDYGSDALIKARCNRELVNTSSSYQVELLDTE